MGHFVNKTSGLVLKRTIPGMMVLFYLCFVVTGLYCRCIENGISHHDNHQTVAQAGSETTADHQHSHDHGHEQPSHNDNPTPHSSCYCNGIDGSALASSFETEFAKTTYAKLLSVDAFQVIALFSYPQFQFVTANDHGPPPQVSVYLKNHSFLI